jgi:ABC-type multidrug transport system fused ATPase/permease subunit
MSLIQLFRAMWPFVRPYRVLVAATLALTVLGSFAAQVNALILRYTVDSVSTMLSQGKGLADGYTLLVTITIVLLGKEILYTVIQFGQKFFGEKLRIFVARDLSGEVVRKILSYRMAFYTSPDNDSGKLQSRIDYGISSLTRLVQSFFIDILPLFANSIVALILMFNANLYVGLVGLCLLPVYFLVSQRQAGKLGGFRRRMREFREGKSNAIIRLIDSITVIKSFGQEQAEAVRHDRLQYDMTENQLQTRRISFLYDGLKNFIEQIGIVLIIILTAYLVLSGQMTIGAIMFHILLFNNVSAPIRQLHRIYDEMNDALVYAESFFGILEADEEREPTGPYRPEVVRGRFELRHVDFRYPSGTHALRDISLTIEPGRITALVGLSGAGKSTLINLLDKFYAPTSGEIRLDGVDLAEYDTDVLRQQVGLVLQRNHIFKGSITENIRYGKPEATMAEVEAVARRAYIHDQVMALPGGYETDARLLSGGQQQRIAIARLFLKDPPIIFLDEPTASLDAIATEQIKQSLDDIKQGRTVIIISHSISQIIDADHIVVLDQGRLVEEGTHDALYDRKGKYYEIFSAMVDSLNIEKIARSLDEES